jgi:hypothetical protein
VVHGEWQTKRQPWQAPGESLDIRDCGRISFRRGSANAEPTCVSAPAGPCQRRNRPSGRVNARRAISSIGHVFEAVKESCGRFAPILLAHSLQVVGFVLKAPIELEKTATLVGRFYKRPYLTALLRFKWPRLAGTRVSLEEICSARVGPWVCRPTSLQWRLVLECLTPHARHWNRDTFR